MPRSKGFSTEDYELCEAVNDATDGRLRPSEACDFAEAWVIPKLIKEASKLWDLGCRDASIALTDFRLNLEKEKL